MSINKNDFFGTKAVAEFDALVEQAATDLAVEDTTGELYGPDGDGATDMIDAWLNQTELDQHRAKLFRLKMADGCDA